MGGWEVDMRRLMVVFGVLDLGVVASHVNRLSSYTVYFSHQPILSVICLLMLGSLVASAVGLFRGRSWALVLGYLQFPFRAALEFFSLGWLATMVLPAHASLLVHEFVWMCTAALEGLRLGLTIMIHRELHHSQAVPAVI
jgi:hypothetical protein